jgi:DNA polymerase-3 subunit delta
VRCRALDADGLAAWARQYAASAGKDLGLEAARRLTQSGGDRSALRNDLDKLVAYVADREAIEMADVVALTAQAPEDVMFRLVDAVSGRRAGDALLLLRRAARYEARDQTLASKLMALLGRQLRLVWQAKELAAAGVAMSGLRALPESIADALPQESSIVSLAWKANALLRDAHLWTRDELTEAFGLLVDTDAANKGEETGSSDVMANLEALIVRLCPAPARRA